jgi:hypothetical protein
MLQKYEMIEDVEELEDGKLFKQVTSDGTDPNQPFEEQKG